MVPMLPRHDSTEGVQLSQDFAGSMNNGRRCKCTILVSYIQLRGPDRDGAQRLIAMPHAYLDYCSLYICAIKHMYYVQYIHTYVDARNQFVLPDLDTPMQSVRPK